MKKALIVTMFVGVMLIGIALRPSRSRPLRPQAPCCMKRTTSW